MCGICGFVYKDRTRLHDLHSLLAMRDSLIHRGPDDEGYYQSSGVGLASRRLSVIDLSERGRMPMSTPDGRYTIVFNGEVYNFQELRASLKSKGINFRSDTDTEVVLHLYAMDGASMLERLNGMFAFAIWDNYKRTLFLARDRMGVKPLYYVEESDALFFASEEKALFAAGIEPEFDQNHLEEILCFRYVAGEQTPYRNVKRLLPGHCLVWKEGQTRIQRWWNLPEIVKEKRENQPQDTNEWFRETFDDSVRLRNISDVPVGVLLSGGLDSGSVAISLASQTNNNISSFTVRFAEPEYDEGPLAQKVAERWKLDFHGLEIKTKDILSLTQKAAWLNDEPLVHGNDPYLLAISKYSKPLVTVLLSGEGADELLGGYVRYKPLRYPNLLNVSRHILPRLSFAINNHGRLRKLSRFLSLNSTDRFVLFNACDVLPEDLLELGLEPASQFSFREQVLSEAKALYPNEPVRQAMYSDQHTFLCSILDRNDRMTMGASIECRTPFLDYRLVETLAAMPTSILMNGRQNKQLLRNSIGTRLPKEIRKHRKWGFGVPWSSYLRRVPELRGLVNDLHNLSPIKECRINPLKLQNMANGFLKGERQNEALIYQLVMLAIWYEACCTKQYVDQPIMTRSIAVNA